MKSANYVMSVSIFIVLIQNFQILKQLKLKLRLSTQALWIQKIKRIQSSQKKKEKVTNAGN